MSNEGPSNQVLAEMIAHLKDIAERDHGEINRRLDIINGQVAKNSVFRAQGKVYLGILGLFGTGLVGLIIERLFI